MPRQPLDRAAATGVSLVMAGSMTANVVSYLLAWLASRWLGPAGYGEFASLLAAQLVLAVPALALQTVVARESVRGRSPDALRSLGYRCAALVTVLAVALTPAMAWLLGTGIGAAFSALVTAPMLVLLATEQGLLQGKGRFVALSSVLAGAGLLKVVPAVAVLALGGGAGAALMAGAAGTALLVALVRVLDRTETPHDAAPVRIGVVSVLAASQVQLALIALSSLDLLIVRLVLDEHDAGVYALGAVATKVAFWLPQAVGVVLYPRMANPAQSAQAVRSALAVLVGIGGVLVVGALVAGPLVPMLAGDDYAAVAPMLWAFALHGAVLAVLQGALLSAIASERTRVAVLAWIGLAVEATTMLVWAKTPGELIGVGVTVASVTAIGVAVAAVRSADRVESALPVTVSSPDE
ncbi:O-antigen/teichoic acid export membrane protein [Rhodococcus sp. 27YEA15]|uniref:lipopolysaccharide biosynthesis protein n=1 Tax=Rhodococcus sp. 27YEA15 TaxID=3156259 RepID=UPI003C7E1046